MATFTTKIIAETTWADVQDNINYGYADFYTPGDVITDKLQDGREFPFVVAAVNHYQQDEVIFVFGESLCDHCMNDENTNEGGWAYSELRGFANNEALSLLPDELQNIIAPVTIIETQRGGKQTACTDKLWAPSLKEVSGEWWYDEQENGVDKQFPYFVDAKNRILRDGTGAVAYWWERSSGIYHSGNFYGVNTDGNPYYSGYWASYRLGVCLGFAIRKSV